MRKNILPLILFIILQGAHHPLFSQLPDSIRVLPDDSSKLNLLKNQAIALCEDEPDKSLDFAKAGIELAQKLKLPVAEGECYKAGGVAYDSKGNLDTCLLFLNKAKAIFTGQKQYKLLANTISDIGLAYYFRGVYQLSLRNQFDALKLREQEGDQSLIAKSYNNIGLIYRVRKDYSKAIEYYLLSLKLKKNLKDSAGQLNSLINISSCYQYQYRYDSALHYSQQTLALSRQINKPKDEANSLANLGVASVGLQQWSEAESFLQEALQKSTAISYKEPMYSVYEGLGKVMLNKKMYDKAIEWFNKGVLLSSESGRKEMLANYYNNLSVCYEKTGDYNQAYNLIKNSEAIRDSLLNEENLRQINEMTVVYETTKKEEKIVVLSKEGKEKDEALTRSRRARNIYIAAALLIAAMAIFAFNAYRRNRKQKELLNRQNGLIEASLKEKETLLREIHHRVKNNLQIISGLLNLQSRQIENTEAQEAVRESRNRVKSMALIHQKLYQQDNLTSINIKEYLSDLTSSVQQTFKDNRTNITVNIDCDDLKLDVDTAIPLGLIINELVTNCYKYAFTGKAEGTISIQLHKQINNLELIVKDNGIGLPESFNPEQTRSFGMKLIQSLAAKLEASMKAFTDNGTVIKLSIPYTNQIA